MVQLLLRLVITAAAVWLAATLFPNHIQVRSVEAALLFAVVLGVLNAVVRPILFFFTLPLTLLTLGLFIIILNALVFWLASLLPVGVEVSGFSGALLGAVIVSVCSLLASLLLPKGDHRTGDR